MTTDRTTEAPPAALVTVGGFFAPGHLAIHIWRALEADIRRRRGEGLGIRADYAQLRDVARAAAYAYESTRGQGGQETQVSADIGPESQVKERLMSTEQMATRLHCSTRHARRLARLHGIDPVARDTWDRDDITSLEVALRS